MLTTQVLCVMALLVVPAVMLALAIRRLGLGQSVGARFGYTSELALTGPQAWAYAQKTSAIRYIMTALLLAVFSLWLFAIVPAKTTAAYAMFTLTMVMFDVVVLIFVIASVEIGLRGLIHPKAAKAH